jgi:hypothetical protein
MSWVFYLKFLSAGKFVLIELLTLNYVFAYFWNAIWLLYQLIIHVCSEVIFRKYIFLQFFLNFQIFSVKHPDGIILHPDGCGSDGRTVKWHIRMRRVLLKDDMAARVRTVTLAAAPLLFPSCFCRLLVHFWCDFLVFSHEFLSYFVPLCFISPFRVFCSIFCILFNSFNY